MKISIKTMNVIIKEVSKLQNKKGKLNAGALREQVRIIFKVVKTLNADQLSEILNYIVQVEKKNV